MSRAPKRQLVRRRRRKRKLRHLRQQLAQTTDAQSRRRLIAKMRRVSTRTPIPDD